MADMYDTLSIHDVKGYTYSTLYSLLKFGEAILYGIGKAVSVKNGKVDDGRASSGSFSQPECSF